MDGHWKFRGGGASQKNRKGKYEAKLEFPEGWGRGGSNQKTTCKGGEEKDYFLEPHITDT